MTLTGRCELNRIDLNLVPYRIYSHTHTSMPASSKIHHKTALVTWKGEENQIYTHKATQTYEFIVKVAKTDLGNLKIQK